MLHVGLLALLAIVAVLILSRLASAAAATVLGRAPQLRLAPLRSGEMPLSSSGFPADRFYKPLSGVPAAWFRLSGGEYALVQEHPELAADRSSSNQFENMRAFSYESFCCSSPDAGCPVRIQ